MKLDWTPAGGSVAHLGDDAATPRKTIRIEQFGGEAVVQEEPLFGAAFPLLISRGNVKGPFVAVVTQSFDTVDLASAFLATEYARIGQKGKVEWTRATTLFTFDNSVLKGVTAALIDGVKIGMRYAWVVGAIT